MENYVDGSVHDKMIYLNADILPETFKNYFEKIRKSDNHEEICRLLESGKGEITHIIGCEDDGYKIYESGNIKSIIDDINQTEIPDNAMIYNMSIRYDGKNYNILFFSDREFKEKVLEEDIETEE